MKTLTGKRGSVFLTTVVILSIASFVAIGLLKYVIATGNLDQRRNDGVVAFYIAEAGVHKVVHFFNHPEDYSADTDLFAYNEDDDEYSNVKNVLDSGNLDIDTEEFPVFKAVSNKTLGQVSELVIMPPPVNGPPCLGVIKSVGRTYSGIEKTVYLYIFDINQPFAQSPAALVSLFGNNDYNGNATVRWGEIWTNANTQIGNQLGNYVDTGDPGWTKVRTTEQLLANGNKYLNGPNNGKNPIPSGAANYYDVYYATNPYGGRFLQHQTLNFPSYDYQAWKDLARQKGEYFSTDAAGNIYRDGIEDAAHRVNYSTEFGISNNATAQYRLVFIDTIDGFAPNATGSNLANMSLGIQGVQTKGMFYINGNLSFTGAGNPPTATIQSPSGSTVTTKLTHDGLLYISGTLSMTGNANFYGSLIVRNQITGAGTPTIYYNYRLKDNLAFPVKSKVQVRLFKVQ